MNLTNFINLTKPKDSKINSKINLKNFEENSKNWNRNLKRNSKRFRENWRTKNIKQNKVISPLKFSPKLSLSCIEERKLTRKLTGKLKNKEHQTNKVVWSIFFQIYKILLWFPDLLFIFRFFDVVVFVVEFEPLTMSWLVRQVVNNGRLQSSSATPSFSVTRFHHGVDGVGLVATEGEKMSWWCSRIPKKISRRPASTVATDVVIVAWRRWWRLESRPSC